MTGNLAAAKLLCMDPRGFPQSLPEFQAAFPNDAACQSHLEEMRWPQGFECPKCGQKSEPYRTVGRPFVLRCRFCHQNHGVTAGTVMQGTHTPLSVWFWGAYLVTTQTPGQSAVQFQRQLGLTRYETAFQILHKLRSGMVRPERDAIGQEWPVEVDETLVGGVNAGAGRGKHKKTFVLGAVEVRTRVEDGKSHKRSIYAGRLRLQVCADRKATTCESFVGANVASGATVRTDGWQGYDGLRTVCGVDHHPLAINGDARLTDAHVPMVHLVFSNLKAWLIGTHHGRVSPRHLQAYCNEFVFRFNRRFYPMTTFHSVLGLAVHATPPTYVSLYSGKWSHPGGSKLLSV